MLFKVLVDLFFNHEIYFPLVFLIYTSLECDWVKETILPSV